MTIPIQSFLTLGIPKKNLTFQFLAGYLTAKRFPSKTRVLQESPSGCTHDRRVCEDANHPMELHTGARIPNELGRSFNTESSANLNWLARPMEIYFTGYGMNTPGHKIEAK